MLNIIFGIILGFIGWWTWEKWALTEFSDEEMAMLYVVLTIGSSVAGVIVLCFGFGYLSNIWNWVGIFRPDLWLLHEAINKAINH